MSYTPDRWLLIDTGKTIKVFATWLGGYTTGDSWKMSSGTLDVIDKDTYWELPQHSGSVYWLYKKNQGLSGWSSGVLADFLRVAPFLKDISIEEAQEKVKQYEAKAPE